MERRGVGRRGGELGSRGRGWGGGGGDGDGKGVVIYRPCNVACVLRCLYESECV